MAESLQSNALTTLNAVKRAIAISGTEYDDWLNMQINAVSQYVERYCNRKFKKAAFAERHRGHGRSHLVLRNYPLIAGTVSVTIDSSPLDTSEYEPMLEEGMLYKPSLWPWSGYLSGIASEPVSSLFNIAVDYQAGYVLPKDSTDENPRTLPCDLEQAVVDIVVARYRRRGSEHVSRETIGPLSSDYLDGMQQSVQDTLNQYRKALV